MAKGIDLSEFNESINYEKLKSEGIEFVILRCGFGKNSYQKDVLFEQHYANCRRVGLKVGAYLFSYANTVEGARLEAENCLNFIKGKSFELPIFYDVEDNATTGKADKFTLTKMCETFCDKIKEAGYDAGVYASLYWFDEKMYVEELVKYKIWLAQWNEKMTADFKVDIWQFSSNGKLNSIKGRVDMNESFIEFNSQPVEKPVENYTIYENGFTREGVYSDTELRTYIGFLNPYETCKCLGIFKNRAIVLYKIDNSNNYKIGFVKWLGGLRNE